MVFIWGVATARFQVFPWSVLQPIEKEISEFIQGDVSEETKISEKISNDLSFRPSRQLFDFTSNNGRAYQQIDIPDLKSRRELPRYYLSEQIQPLPGYRFIFGSFDYKTHLHGGILLDQHNNLVQTWVVDEAGIQEVLKKETAKDGAERIHKPPARRLPQGVDIFPDGSIVFNDGDRGNGMHRMDRCGRYTWSTLGHFHHAITLDKDSGSIWSFGSEDMMNLDPETGEVLQTISLTDVRLANPELSIFSPRRDLRHGKWHYDPIHKNDIEALSGDDAVSFPNFSAGDLLVSHRATNLVFVFSPTTLKVKWWRAGQTRRQHDPDWQSGGVFTVFDNNLLENYAEDWDGYLPDGNEGRYSRIWEINPDDFSAEIIYDGKRDNMYSGERSKHQLLPNGNFLVTSAHQGRVLEVTSQGETVFEFLNTYDDEQNLILSEAIWLPMDYFDDSFANAPECN